MNFINCYNKYTIVCITISHQVCIDTKNKKKQNLKQNDKENKYFKFIETLRNSTFVYHFLNNIVLNIAHI